LIDQVKENLSRKPVESLAQSATTHDLYESMLLISNTNLQVLNRLKLAETMQTTERNLIQNVFPLLELNLQERVWEIQTQQLQNTLQEVRAQMRR
jgi:hypothetical protein